MRKKLLLVFLMVMSAFLPVGSTSALTTTELYNNAANNIFFYVKGDNACNPSEMAGYVPTVTGDQITWIGDGWSVFAKQVIETKYPGVSLFAENGRTLSESGSVESGLDAVKRLAENSAFRKYVVFALGANGGADKTEEEVKTIISDLMSAVGDDKMVVLTTVRTRTNDYENFNKAVKSAASDSDKILVADFESAVKDKIEEYFEKGHNALNEAGYNLFVSTVKSALDSYTASTAEKAPSTVGAALGPTVASTTSTDTSTVEGRVRMIAELLIGAGYDLNATAGILGNLQGENGSFDPARIENNLYRGGPCSGGVASGSNWRITNKSDWPGYPGKCGFGIVQWTSSGRQDGLQSFADKGGWSVVSLETQVGYLMEELKSNSYKCAPGNLNNKSLEETTFYVLRDFETPDGFSRFRTSFDTAKSMGAFTTRFGYAQKWKQFIEENHIAGVIWSGGGTTGAICSTNVQGAAGLAMLAREMSWPEDNGTCLDGGGGVHKWKDSSCLPNPRAKYRDVVQELRTKGIYIPKFMDCSYFIASVVRYSGLDDKWPAPGGSEPAWRYVNSAEGQQLWEKIDNLGNTSNLMPGDIFTYPRANGRAGHVMMYIGEYGGRFGNMAGASLNNNVAMVGKIYFNHADNGSGAGNKFTISRYKGSATFDLGSEPTDVEDPGETPSENNNECNGGVVKGKSYKSEMANYKLQQIARIINGMGCNSITSCRAFASYLANRYEHLGSPGGDVYKWIMSEYKGKFPGLEPSSTSPAMMGAKYVFNTEGAQDGKGNRTLPGNVYEMLEPNKVEWIKVDGTDATKVRGNLISKTQLTQLVQGVSKGIVKGYSKDMDFYCGAKNDAGDYTYLFWLYNKRSGMEELK